MSVGKSSVGGEAAHRRKARTRHMGVSCPNNVLRNGLPAGLRKEKKVENKKTKKSIQRVRADDLERVRASLDVLVRSTLVLADIALDKSLDRKQRVEALKAIKSTWEPIRQ